MFKVKIIPNSGGMFAIWRGEQLIKGGTRQDINMFLEQTESKDPEHKGTFYCIPGCTECCQQLIKVSQAEIFRIRRYLRGLNPDDVQRLKEQPRQEGFCPLLDTEKGTCSVYEVRPGVCREFGNHTGAMACSYNLDVELDPVEQYFLNMLNDSEAYAGRLGTDFNWDKGLVR